jgi:hypothetical protein
MNALTRLTSGLVAVALLASFGYAAYLGLQQFATLYSSLDAQVAAVTAIAAVALLLSAWWIALAIRRVGRDRLAVPLREEKAATYRLFVDCWQRRLHVRGESSELDDAMTSLGRLLALFGSAAVVEKHAQLQAGSGDGWTLFTEALQQIRRELDAEPLAGAALQAVLASHAVRPDEMESHLAVASAA